MLKKKKTTASGKLVLVKSVRRHWTSGGCPLSADRSGTETAQPQNEILCSKGLGALPRASKRRGKSRRDFLLCGPVCINTGIACLFSFQIFRTTLSVLSPFPGCDAAGCHAFLADSWNKAFSPD
jgi:hypothetical protein